ncbi:MAG: NAD(P)/FAD-dependent oxidoreductase [Bacteroidetes bacterium]|nr:NAD(P)/FAD-dependent oxidoreductase [Fibrella sp.]
MITTRAIVLATGLVDLLPPIPGLHESWGKDAHVCPCFSGYEVQDKRLVVFGLPERLPQSGKFLTAWSPYVTVVTSHEFEPVVNERLHKLGVVVVRDEVSALVRRDDRLIAVSTDGGKTIPCDGVFISAAMRAASNLAATLCEVDETGFAVVDPNGKTSRAGVWAIGNASDPLSHLIHAAAAGAQAGPWINDYLIDLSLVTIKN